LAWAVGVLAVKVAMVAMEAVTEAPVAREEVVMVGWVVALVCTFRGNRCPQSVSVRTSSILSVVLVLCPEILEVPRGLDVVVVVQEKT
jgi:hypothetical protein